MYPERSQLRTGVPMKSSRIWSSCMFVSLAIVTLMLVSGGVSADDSLGSIRDPAPPDETAYRKIQFDLRDAMKKRQLSPADKAILDKAAHHLVFKLIDPDERFNVGSNRRRIEQILRSRNVSEASRQYFLEQLALRSGQLLNEEEGAEKVQGVLLLKDLNTSFSTDRDVPDIPFVGGYKYLLMAFQVEDKFVDSKLNAAEGLGRILRDGEPALTVRVEIAEALADEIQTLVEKTNAQQKGLNIGDSFFMRKAVTALGYCERITDLSGAPDFPDALMAVLANDKIDWFTRARAAHALSYLPYDANSNLSVINYETARLLRDMATTYNSNPNEWPLWRDAMIECYLAFSARGNKERGNQIGLKYQVERSGLGKYKTEIDQAYGAMMPVINTLSPFPFDNPRVRRPQIKQEDIDKLSEWVNGHDPGTRKITPNSREIGRSPKAPGMANRETAASNNGG